MQRNEDGYIVVETIGTFALFTFLVISILSLINIVTIQTRVHYALTQTANELSMYSYVIDALGLSADIMALDKTGQEVQSDISQVQNDLNAIQGGLVTPPNSTTEFFDNLDAIIDAVGSLGNTTGNILQDPNGTFVEVVRYGLNASKNYSVQKLINNMLKKYLQNGDQDADSFLCAYGVDGGLSSVELNKSRIIDSEGNITIIASYEINYAFGILPLPFTTIYVEQTAKTKAWLGGVDNE